MEPLEELKKRGIEYLLSRRSKPKQAHEFSVRELAPILDICESSVYEYMKPLVDKKIWATRMAYDDAIHRDIKVWWLVEQDNSGG